MRRVAALLALSLLVAACGSKSSSSNAPTTTATATPNLQAAVSKTIAAGSEHVAIVAATKAAGQNVQLSGSGDFDATTRTGKLHTTVAMATLRPVLDEVLSGSTVYVSAPQLLSPLLPAGKTWLRIDLANAGKTFGLSPSVLQAQDPSQSLAQLKAITAVQDLGSETIGGVQTEHYRGRIDPAKLAAAERQALSKSGTTFGPYDVWVGSDGYVHKVRVVTNTSGTKTTATVTLSKFGEKVIVDVPATADTVDASKLSIPGLTG
ncbi:MAG TPA: LppX_LprAFG lipoprotein [Gaiellaceae bacterium]|nr:LppX_LprAFG lipoprotein [Gaiellaceae bacterium]